LRRVPDSFPTRRSSDLGARGGEGSFAAGVEAGREGGASDRRPLIGHEFADLEAAAFFGRSAPQLQFALGSAGGQDQGCVGRKQGDRKSTRLNSSHLGIS